MIKTLHILYSGLGGHGNVFFSLVAADQKKEFQYHALFAGIEQVRKEYIKSCEKFGIPWKFLLKKKGFDPLIYYRILKKIVSLKPRVTILHGPSFILPVALAKLVRPEMKIIVRDTQAHHLKSKADWFWLKKVIWFADKLILLTEEAKAVLIKTFPGKKLEKKIAIIPNGIDIGKYARKALRDLQNPVVIGMQSRLQKNKDHITLIKSISILRSRGYEVELRIAGGGETLDELKKLSDELGVSQYVRFYGMLDQNELLQFMHELDIYVHASFGETMSNSIIQAMACGLPIIASDVWGVNNMLINDQTGLLFPLQDTESLASRIESLIGDSEKRNRLGKAAHLYACNRFSNETMFMNYKNLIVEIVR